MTFHASCQLGYRRLIWATVAVLGFNSSAVCPSSAEEDLQFWMPVQLIHPLTDKLNFSIQAEIRLQDDISTFSELVLKPGSNYNLNKHSQVELEI